MKYVGAAEFKANCLKLMAEVQAGGEPITVTKRGKPMAVVSASEEAKPELESMFGCMAGTVTILGDIMAPVVDPDWEAQWEAKWDRKLREADEDAA